MESPSGKRLAYMPAVPHITDALREELECVDVLLFDGTFWSDDELIRIQGSGQTAKQMGHVPVSCSQAQLAQLQRPRKIYIHINNTNPMLNEAGPRISAGARRRLGNRGGWMAVRTLEESAERLLSFDELRAQLRGRGRRTLSPQASVPFADA